MIDQILNDNERMALELVRYEEDFLEIKNAMMAQMADLDEFTLKFRVLGQLIDKILEKHNLIEI